MSVWVCDRFVACLLAYVIGTEEGDSGSDC